MNLILLAMKSKYAQAGIVGIIIGYVIGSIWVGKEQDEMMRQMVKVLLIATGQ